MVRFEETQLVRDRAEVLNAILGTVLFLLLTGFWAYLWVH